MPLTGSVRVEKLLRRLPIGVETVFEHGIEAAGGGRAAARVIRSTGFEARHRSSIASQIIL
jgi:hypothetical protein